MPRKSISIKDGLAEKGVFTERPIKYGVLIDPIDGQVVQGKHYTSPYAIHINRHFSLDPARPYRFLNHSCDPNCEILWAKSAGGLRMSLHSRRRILRGEELTVDYGWPPWAAIQCNCKSAKCRGWVVAKKYVTRVAARELSKRFSGDQCVTVFFDCPLLGASQLVETLNLESDSIVVGDSPGARWLRAKCEGKSLVAARILRRWLDLRNRRGRSIQIEPTCLRRKEKLVVILRQPRRALMSAVNNSTRLNACVSIGEQSAEAKLRNFLLERILDS